MTIENALAPLTLIVERLRSEAPDFLDVLTAPDLATVLESQQRSPSATVMYDGYVVPGGVQHRAGDGVAQVILQRYAVIVAVKHAGDPARKRNATLIAGECWMQVFKALAGWQPMVGMRPLRLTTAQRPAYAPAFAYIPLAFEAELILA